MSPRWLWLSSALLAGLLAGTGVFVYQQRKPKEPAAAAPVQPAAIPSEITMTGSVRARNIVAVPAPTDGTLEAVELMDGQQVFEGQLLARVRNVRLDLEREEAKLELDRLQERVNSLESQLISGRLEASRADADATRARAEFTIADRDYQRQKMLLAEGATPRLTYEKSEKEYRTLKAESEALSDIASAVTTKLDITQRTLTDARRILAERTRDMEAVEGALLEGEVHAPVDGLLLAHRAGPGDEVNIGMRDLFQIAANLTELEFTAPLDPSDAKYIQPGQPALVQIAEAGNQALEGTVKSVTGGELVVEFISPSATIRPGLSAVVRIPIDPSISPAAGTLSGSR